jgi:hypothetical protein
MNTYRRLALLTFVLLSTAVPALLRPEVFASAEEGRFAISWRAPAACPQRTDIEARVQSLLARGSGNQSPVEAQADITIEGARYALKLRIKRPGQPESLRSLAAWGCESLSDAASLVIALAIDPEVRAPAWDDAAPGVDGARDPDAGGVSLAPQDAGLEAAAILEADAQLAFVPPPLSAVPPAPPEVPSPSMRPELWTGLAAGLDTNMLPAPAPFGQLALGVRLGRFALSAEGALFGPQRELNSLGLGARFWAASVGLRLCAVPARYALLPSASLELALCAGARAVHVASSGRGTERIADDARWLGSLNLDPRLALRLNESRLAPFVGVGLQLPLSRPIYAVNGQIVHQLPAASVQLLFGLQLKLW